MAVTVPGLKFDFTQTSATTFFMKSTHDAYHHDGSVLTKISDADYPSETVPGVAFLNGYVFVMDTDGQIFNSDLEAYTSWNPLNFVTAESVPGRGVGLAKHQNYVVAFKDSSLEFFYDAATTSGSPLAPLISAVVQTGCVNGHTVAQVDGGLAFVSRHQQRGRSVSFISANSLQPVDIGNDALRRILNGSNLDEAYGWGAKISGQVFYFLNIKSAGITLVYEFTSQTWAQWTLSTLGTNKTVSSLSQTGGVATATCSSHGFSDGDSITISGATPSGYNGSFNITFVDANTFTFPVSSALSSPATGTIRARGWTEGYFPFSFSTSTYDEDLGQSDIDAKVVRFSSDYTDDDGALIDKRVRTAKFDAGNTSRKSFYSLTIVSDQVSANSLVRYTDDDYQTYSKFRSVSLSDDKSQLRRLGMFRRRAFEFRITDDVFVRISSIDADVEQGA